MYVHTVERLALATQLKQYPIKPWHDLISVIIKEVSYIRRIEVPGVVDWNPLLL